ncbi:diguanylate cyclase [Erwiniaceae bacterium BAC15a-03b]|uniref:diguanylate cyclase n=1 Tax=Winslowiella arboricola TaxID=2978220 RepID=A0A9J6PTC3_9GAMM|nr:diguanylate cyclase [Winslowiella arboricola]MCU5774261.1 diguanylate cyclase [Winslowiella arboricola]MCU5778808.1 diguanylate cyclase [Winslowiella arboricola]
MTTDIFPYRPATPLWRTAFLFGALSFLLTLFCLELIMVIGRISPLWFPTALMTVVVFRYPARALLPILLCCMTAVIVANAIIFGPSVACITFPLVNLLQALMGGFWLRLLLDRDNPLNSLTSWYKMMLTVGLITPLLGGLMASWLLHQTHATSLQFFITWVISEVIGMLSLGPVALLWQPGYFRKQLQRPARIEAAIILVVTLALSYLALRFLPWPFTFVIVILFWSAVRLPRLEAFLVYLANIAMMSLMLAFHLLDLRGVGVSHAFIATAPWLPFLLALIPSHMMTMVMHAFGEDRKRIIDSENRFRSAMEHSAIGMALVSTEGALLKVNKSLCQFLGYQADELQRLSFQQITYPDDLNADLEQFSAMHEGSLETYTMEKRYYRKDSQIVWARLSVSMARDSGQNPLYFISQIEDITELKRSTEVNRLLMERITLANEAGGIGVWEWNFVEDIISWDKQMYEIFELRNGERPTYEFWLSRIVPEDREMADQAVQRALDQQETLNVEYRIFSVRGIRYVRTQANRILSREGHIERMLGVAQDITEVRALNDALFQEKERMLITLDSIGEAVISTDEDMLVTFMNPVAERISGWSQSAAAGKHLSTILHITHGRDGPEMESLLLCDLPLVKTTPDFDHDLVLHNASGEQFDIHYSITPLKTLAGRSKGSVMVIHDVSESREMLKRLSYSASHDMLTRLPNRSSFEHQLKRLLVSASEHQQQHVLIFIDLDRFKAINDTAGHAAGDALLRELANLMQSQLRSTDLLARLGGDEFGLLFNDCALDHAKEVVQRLVTSINEYRFLWEGRLYRVGASAGLTQIRRDNCISSDVMAQADLACYNAKHNGRGQISVYEARLQRQLRPVMTHGEIMHIINDNPLRLLARAVTPPRKTQSVSFWLAELQLFSSAGQEIDEAEFRANLQEPQQTIALDRKVINIFYASYAEGIASKSIGIALPLSGYSLKDDAFIDELVSKISAGKVNGNLLWFMPEAEALLEQHDGLHANVARLRKLGCGIILRNFGRNLDAFNVLHADEIDYLMFSADLIANVHCNLMDEMMVSIIHGHAQRLNIATVAGPVELPVALTTLATIGVNVVWGEAISGRESLSALLSHNSFAIK